MSHEDHDPSSDAESEYERIQWPGENYEDEATPPPEPQVMPQPPVEVAFPQGDATKSVWLVRDIDDFRAMHDMLALRTGDQTRIFECSGWADTKPIELLLGLGGFSGSATTSVTAREVESDTPVVLLRGFVVPEGEEGDVVNAIHLALSGKLGGFHPLVQAQVGFHRCVMAFEYAWDAAGRPAVIVRHPELVDGAASSADGPSEVKEHADGNPTLAMVRQMEGDVSDHWVRGD